MKNDPFSDDRVLEAWQQNARPWTDAVRDEKIASRKLVTNQAIVDAVLSKAPATALDIGCGEGWLSRALSDDGIEVVGVDAIPELIEQAKRAGGGEFRVMSYEDIAGGKLRETFDVVVANFALIGKDSVDRLIARVPDLLNDDGSLIIQTLHPVVACGDLPYEDGWREGSWAGIDGDFAAPAPWFFRTMETWVELLSKSGLGAIEVREPRYPHTGEHASMILVAATGHAIS